MSKTVWPPLPDRKKSSYRADMARIALIAAALALQAALATAGAEPVKPQRIVSMNQCTDLFVLMLAEPERVASVSFVSKQTQWMPPEYAGALARIPSNHALTEEILPLKPDLVVTTPWTGGAAVRLLRRLGYRVEMFEPEVTLDDIRKNVLRMGELIGEPDRAKEAVASFDARLAAIEDKTGSSDRVIALFGVNGYTAGKDTLSAAAAAAAGFRTLGEKMGFSGFRFVSLEQILAQAPNVLAPSNAWTEPPSMATDAMNHPVMRKFAETSSVVSISERLLVCGSPAALDAVDLMARARK
jgi:iron complex transport system substrate-binding protein